MIHACQARIVSDLEMVDRGLPDPVSMSARVAELVRLGARRRRRRPRAPAAVPAICRANTASCNFAVSRRDAIARPIRLRARPNDRLLHFHIRRLPDGAVSSALGHKIRVGHRVKLTGPFGSAFLRPNHRGRVVLVASGTGFAPMWSIAAAAITERPQRELIFVVATRKLQSFYMHGALCRLARFPNVTIVPVVSEPQNVSSAIRGGRPLDYMPKLSPEDIVYTAGAPAMTEAVARIARTAGAVLHRPFVPNAKTDRASRSDGTSCSAGLDDSRKLYLQNEVCVNFFKKKTQFTCRSLPAQ